MGLNDFWSEVKDHRELTEELHDTPWWQGLMNDPHFHAAYESNYHARLKLSDSRYLKKLMRSETERRSFIDEVFHPGPNDLAAEDDD
ncbi:MAG TPA: hypothetical protein VFV52_09110 [Bacilli bacterium]|nr:hypothetical protein [Bacilli bacterium]